MQKKLIQNYRKPIAVLSGVFYYRGSSLCGVACWTGGLYSVKVTLFTQLFTCEQEQRSSAVESSMLGKLPAGHNLDRSAQ